MTEEEEEDGDMSCRAKDAAVAAPTRRRFATGGPSPAAAAADFLRTKLVAGGELDRRE